MSRNTFYSALEGIHNLYFNELRCGQFLDLFVKYVENDSDVDIYYATNDELEKVLKGFIDKYIKEK